MPCSEPGLRRSPSTGPRGDHRFNGVEVVEIAIYTEGDANIVTTARTVGERLPEFEAMLPEGYTRTVLFDQSRFIEPAIHEVRSAAVVGGVLVVLMLLVFLRDFRSTAIIATSIPLSVLFEIVPRALTAIMELSMVLPRPSCLDAEGRLDFDQLLDDFRAPSEVAPPSISRRSRSARSAFSRGGWRQGHQGRHGWVRDIAIPSAAGNKTFGYVVVGTHGRPPLLVLEVDDFNDATAFRDQIPPLAQDVPALHLVGFAADSRPVGDRSACAAALGN